MNFFRNIFFYFSRKKLVKTLNQQINDWDALLRSFWVISIDPAILNKADRLRGDKKSVSLIHALSAEVDTVTQHNQKIRMLQDRFDEIIKNHTIRTILLNIDKYSLEQLRSFNETALQIGEYSIPDSFPDKKDYLSYIRDIGELINDYPAIVEQFSLIRDFNAISFTLGDEYIDESMADVILKPARDLIEKIKSLGSKYYNIPQLDKKIIERHNEQYINNHLNDPIFDNVNGKSLDEEQRRAILCDPKSNLVIAGAGAGKTLTICGKVKWLLDTQKVQENEILLLSYSKASAEDLAEKINGIRSGLKVKTFHSFGLEVLNCAHGSKQAVEDQFKSYIKKFFDAELNSRPDLCATVFRFFSYYLYADIDDKQYDTEGEKFEDLKTADYRTLKERLGSLSEDLRELETIQQEYVKSYEELVIANFLFTNGIKYEYERPYEINTATPDKRQYTPDFYLPDYHIYIEHYGVNEDWKTPQYSKAEEKKYLESIRWKRATHAANGTICLETYSYEFRNGQIFQNLTQRLRKNGVQFKPLTEKEIMHALHSIYSGQEFSSFFNLLSTFISLYKSKYPDETGFEELRKQNFSSLYDKERTYAFLDICKEIYRYYISALRAENKIDFDDMILQTIDALDTIPGYRYRYVIVDEFQDISQSRAKLLKAIIAHGSSKLFAVGDDWQAIYRFAGCDIDVFLHFDLYFDDVKRNCITSTHRNSMELQSVVEPFITANPEQYVKHIRSLKHEKSPVRIIYHNNSKMTAFLQALQNISKIDTRANVLVLGRNYHDIDQILRLKDIKIDKQDNLFCKEFPQMKITYRTVHRSKGLESDFVILISGENARNGFPNKMEDDRLLELVLGDKSNFEFAEERRLFYVALTRTRSIVYVLCDKLRPSVFVKEIAEKIKTENPKTAETGKAAEILCPRCKSGKLTLRSTGAKNAEFYGCSNFPYCRYTINDVHAVIRANRCPDCGDFLVVRFGKYGKFIGCHNYPYCTFKKQIHENQNRHRFPIGFGDR